MSNATKVSDDTPIAMLDLWKHHRKALTRAGLHTVGDLRRVESEIGLLAVFGISFGVRRRILTLIGDDAGTNFGEEE